ncbi:MAG TPA: SAP domain-containing protein, partial [Candidatus Thalassarchaeaceae archaeon]|nr:SAP domain-containing protein [Candidatus Thalassarchaeaceae archaeon]
AGAGSDTVITMEGNSDSSGRISLANASNIIQEETEEDEVEDEVEEEEEDEEVVELPANLSGLLKSELVDLAKSIGISDSGTKADIIERLESQPMY